MPDPSRLSPEEARELHRAGHDDDLALLAGAETNARRLDRIHRAALVIVCAAGLLAVLSWFVPRALAGPFLGGAVAFMVAGLVIHRATR